MLFECLESVVFSLSFPVPSVFLFGFVSVFSRLYKYICIVGTIVKVKMCCVELMSVFM